MMRRRCGKVLRGFGVESERCRGLKRRYWVKYRLTLVRDKQRTLGIFSMLRVREIIWVDFGR